jgi:hypothetical protein
VKAISGRPPLHGGHLFHPPTGFGATNGHDNVDRLSDQLRIGQYTGLLNQLPTRISAPPVSSASTVPTPPGWPVFHALSSVSATYQPVVKRSVTPSGVCSASSTCRATGHAQNPWDRAGGRRAVDRGRPGSDSWEAGSKKICRERSFARRPFTISHKDRSRVRKIEALTARPCFRSSRSSPRRCVAG